MSAKQNAATAVARSILFAVLAAVSFAAAVGGFYMTGLLIRCGMWAFHAGLGR